MLTSRLGIRDYLLAEFRVWTSRRKNGAWERKKDYWDYASLDIMKSWRENKERKFQGEVIIFHKLKQHLRGHIRNEKKKKFLMKARARSADMY